EETREQLRHPLPLASLQFRSAALLGLLFGMTVRPDQTVFPMEVYLAAVIAAIGLGLWIHRQRTDGSGR
ncbi:MAG TPA: hypothetical protein VGY54_13965, partial [Polyangiaceae bacterium]|nr:hypothetical protein [Polyangiaceae bacterium]